MEIKVDRVEFSKSIAKVQGIVERKNTMPVLSNCLIKASKNEIEILATDLEITIIDRCKAQVKKGGSICINAKKIFEIFREMEEGEIALQAVDGNKIEIIGKNTHYDIQGINPEEFPPLPGDEGFNFMELDAAMLSEMIGKTIYAAASEEGRFMLNGIYMEKLNEQEGVRFVATDGHRLALVDRLLEGVKGLKLDKGVILPKKGMMELHKLITSYQGKVKLGVKDNHVALKIEDTSLFMRLVDGEFPEYGRVIPEGNNVNTVIGREEFLKSLKRASIMVDEKLRSVKVTFSPGKLIIEGRNPNQGVGLGEADCEYSGVQQEIGFNDRYLFDIINAIPEGKVIIRLKDELSPILFNSEKDDKYVCVVMPMRI